MRGEENTELTVLLGGHLREEMGRGGGEIQVQMPDPPTLEGLLELLGLAHQRAKLILVNGRGATAATVLRPGDRVAIFPPELSFNTFVSLSFRKECVAARIQSASEKGGIPDAQD